MTDLPPPSGPPPGWYTDPATGHGFRWWDGTAWTDQTVATLGPATVGSAAGQRLTPPGHWLREALRLGLSRAGHLFPLVVVLSVPASLLFGAAFWYALHDAVITSDTATGRFSFSNPGSGPARYALVGVTVVVSLLASAVLSAAAIHQAQAALEEEPEPWSASLQAALRRLPAVLVAAFAVGFALVGLYLLMLASAKASPTLILLTFPLWVVGSALAGVRLSLAMAGAVVAPSPRGVLSRSWELTRTRFWALLGRLVLLMLAGLSVLFLAEVVASPLIAIAGGGAKTTVTPGATRIALADVLGDNPAAFAIGQLFNALGGGAATILAGIATLLLYRELGGPTIPVAEAGSGADSPEPAASGEA